MICLDEDGKVIRPALLWNDTRSARAAEDLVAELGGPQAWADAVGSVPVASFTVTKLRWLAENEPANAARTAAVCLPHDWLTWKFAGATDGGSLATDRSDASGTGYWSPATGTYRPDLTEARAGPRAARTRCGWPPIDRPARPQAGPVLGAGAGDNAAAALGVGAEVGDVVVSIGTSGCGLRRQPVADRDPSGTVAGFASATGEFLPLVCTLNAARVLDAAAAMLQVDHSGLSQLALNAPPGAEGSSPRAISGRRTHAQSARRHRRVAWTDARHQQPPRTWPERQSRACCAGWPTVLTPLERHGARINRIILVGGGARSEALRLIAPSILGHPVAVPSPGEYVANGAAIQAAWVISDAPHPPSWGTADEQLYEGDAIPAIRERYAAARDLTVPQRRTGRSRDDSER
jgi:xylulokinase